MEVQFTPDVQARLKERATQEGMNPDEVVRDVVARYFEEETVSLKPLNAARRP